MGASRWCPLLPHDNQGQAEHSQPDCRGEEKMKSPAPLAGNRNCVRCCLQDSIHNRPNYCCGAKRHSRLCAFAAMRLGEAGCTWHRRASWLTVAEV